MAAKLEPRLLQAIQKFTTCDIGDALVKLKVPHGGYLSGLKMYSPTYCSGPAKICGPAYTIRMVKASETAPSPAAHFADTIPRNSVVYVSQPKGLLSACWGGLMSTRAKELGAAGVVIDGRFRDINEHRDLGMGLFARDASILGSGGFTKCAGLGEDLVYAVEDLGEVSVRTGDIVMGDADGVVVVPVEQVEKCIELCQERADIDEKTMEALKTGEEIGPTIKRLRK